MAQEGPFFDRRFEELKATAEAGTVPQADAQPDVVVAARCFESNHCYGHAGTFLRQKYTHSACTNVGGPGVEDHSEGSSESEPNADIGTITREDSARSARYP